MRRIDVLVIGAGASGLAAAQRLVRAGAETVVLEARDRIGGRMFTDRTHGVPVELGGELIHGSDVETWDVVREHGIRTVALQDVAYRRDGIIQPFTLDDLTSRIPQPSPLPDASETRMSYLERIFGPVAAWPMYLRFLHIDGEPFDRVSAGAGIGAMCGVDSTGVYGFDDFRVPGGYDQVVQAMATELEIRPQRVVTSVQTRERYVDVVDASDDVWRANHVVVTLPIGVLKARSVLFDPPLPEANQRAIDALGVTSVAKLIYGFDRRVLPDGIDVIMDVDADLPIWWDGSKGTDWPGQIVVGWSAGTSSRRMRASDDPLARGLEAMRAFFDDPLLTPEFATWHDWEADPYARGAYSFMPPGAECGWGDLGTPFGRVHFAGEATNPDEPETVHGAIGSGWRAADEVISSR